MAYNYDPRQSLAANLESFYNPGAGTPESGGTWLGGMGINRTAYPVMTAFQETTPGGDYGGLAAFDIIQKLGPYATLDQVNAALVQQGLRPFANAQELDIRNTALPGHNAENFTGLWGAPLDIGVAAGLGYAGGGAAGLYGAPGAAAAPSAAAGGITGAPTAMTSAPGAIAGSAAPGTPLFSTAATTGTNAFGGAFSTPAMTTFAGPTGTALGGFTAPATLGASGTLAGAGALGGGVASGADYFGGITPPSAAGTGAVGTGSAAAGAGAAAGVGGTGLSALLSSPTALGMAGGALLGGLGGSEQAGTITVEEGIPDWLKPYAKPTLDKYATDIANYQIDPYGIMPSAMQEFQRTINGQYLDPSTNKYLEDYFRLGAERVKGSLSPSFGHMNAFGQHSGYNEALSRGLSDLAVGIYGGNYTKERDRMSQMTASAPNFLTGASSSAFAPYQQYLNTVGSLGKKKDQPYFDNPFGNILGGAMLGGSLGSIWK
jgi:hypothetical protein